MIDLLIEYRHWLAGMVMGVGFVGLFIRQEVAHKRRLRRMARECRHELGQEGQPLRLAVRILGGMA